MHYDFLVTNDSADHKARCCGRVAPRTLGVTSPAAPASGAALHTPPPALTQGSTSLPVAMVTNGSAETQNWLPSVCAPLFYPQQKMNSRQSAKEMT